MDNVEPVDVFAPDTPHDLAIAGLMAMGMPESYAEFVLAVTHGEIDGDVIELPEDPNDS